jgi:hypothetical protein
MADNGVIPFSPVCFSRVFPVFAPTPQYSKVALVPNGIFRFFPFPVPFGQYPGSGRDEAIKAPKQEKLNFCLNQTGLFRPGTREQLSLSAGFSKTSF